MLLPSQRNIQISLSSDGLALLFDQETNIVPSSETSTDESAIESRLWLLPLDINLLVQETYTQVEPEILPFVGLRPKWLP